MSREEVYDFLFKSEKDAHEYCIKELKSVFQQTANQNLLRKFNEHFKKDDTGKRRDWQAIEEAKIREHFEESKQKVNTVFEQFKRIFFPTGITQIEKSDTTPDSRASNASVSIDGLIENAAKEDTNGGPGDDDDPGFGK